MARKDECQLVTLRPPDINVRIVLRPRNPVTVCEILNRKTGKIISYGISRCKHGDQYDRVLGMKYALKSALSKLSNHDYYEATDSSSLQIVREARTSIWNTFNKHFPLMERVVETDRIQLLPASTIRAIGISLSKARTGQL